MRQHGFQRPFSWTQALVVAGSLLSTCLFSAGTLPLLPKTAVYFAGAVYSLLTFLTAGLWVSLTASDPTDLTVNGGKWCTRCQLFVNVRSCHCRQCHRCVINLDHHCKWLNNCIGEVNYYRFLALSGVFIVQSSFELTLSCVVLALLTEGDKETAELAAARLPEMENAVLTCALFTGVVLAVATVRVFLMLPLMVFHVYLRCVGLTTYTYFVGKFRKPAVAPSTAHIELEPKVNTTVPEEDSANPGK